MFKRMRIALLVYGLLFVSVGGYLTAKRATEWEQPLWVDVYPVNADGSAATQAYVDGIEARQFQALEDFFGREIRRYGLALEQPFRFNLAPALREPLPELPEGRSVVGAVLFSLSMRLEVAKLNWSSQRPTPDIVLFVIYHDPETTQLIERSGALRKGMIAIANVFADPGMAGSNQVVIAHEILHTLGATDKYDPGTGLPTHPDGFAEPHRTALFPQAQAELMGGRIPLSRSEAAIPASLHQVLLGPATAAEIGWLDASR